MSVKSTSTILAGICALVIFHAGLAYAKHFPVKLKGYDGKELSIDSKEPYSPKQTCGTCHNYMEITNGYHFQQGRTDASGKVVISDQFNPKKPWILSAGMFGKW